MTLMNARRAVYSLAFISVDAVPRPAFLLPSFFILRGRRAR